MIQSLLSIIFSIIVFLLMSIFPFGLTKKERIVISIAALFISNVGFLVTRELGTPQAFLIAVLLVLLVTVLIDSRLKRLSYSLPIKQNYANAPFIDGSEGNDTYKKKEEASQPKQSINQEKQVYLEKATDYEIEPISNAMPEVHLPTKTNINSFFEEVEEDISFLAKRIESFSTDSNEKMIDHIDRLDEEHAGYMAVIEQLLEDDGTILKQEEGFIQSDVNSADFDKVLDEIAATQDLTLEELSEELLDRGPKNKVINWNEDTIEPIAFDLGDRKREQPGRNNKGAEY